MCLWFSVGCTLESPENFQTKQNPTVPAGRQMMHALSYISKLKYGSHGNGEQNCSYQKSGGPREERSERGRLIGPVIETGRTGDVYCSMTRGRVTDKDNLKVAS